MGERERERIEMFTEEKKSDQCYYRPCRQRKYLKEMRIGKVASTEPSYLSIQTKFNGIEYLFEWDEIHTHP